MVLSKPVSSLTWADIEGLTSSGEPESVVLDYKRAISGADPRDKGELAKDVSAFANSQGGLILIGVEERRAKPVHPPIGIERMLGQQKVEEWIDQVIASNISPRVPVAMQVIDHPTEDSRCIVAIQAPASPRAPHMVTTDGDNRYYRRYFKRQQYQSLPAEEYEVRELFHRSSRMRDDVKAFLKSRGITDISYAEYGTNNFSRRLSSRREVEGKGSIPDRATSFIVLTSCPEVQSPQRISVREDDFWDWMRPEVRLYPPVGPFVPHRMNRPISQGALFVVHETSAAATPNLWAQYLFVHETGYVEMGLSGALHHQGLMAFPLTTMVARYWQFVRFSADLYRRYAILWPSELAVHLHNTQDTVLFQLGKGWREPFDQFDPYRPACLEPHVVSSISLVASDATEEAIEEAVRKMAADIDFAFGVRDSRAWGHPKHDPDQSLRTSYVERY